MQTGSKKYFKVYRSSAGSGKTYTLVKEYLQLVLANPQKYRRILALTFTNKAAEEMKERILKQLNSLVYAKDIKNDTLARDLQQNLNISEETLRYNAKTVLEDILHNYSDFAISTLDSFMHRVVNSFAYDLRLPMNFDVELETEDLITEAIDTLLERIGDDELLTDILMKFAESNFLQEKNWQIDRDLKQVSTEIFKENAPTRLDRLKSTSFSGFIKQAALYEAQTKSFETAVESIAKEAVAQIQSKGLRVEDFASGKSGIANYFANLRKFNFDKLEPNSRIADTVENDKWYAGKASPESKEAIDTLKPFLADSYHKIQALAANKKQYITEKLMLEKIYEVALLNEIYHIIDEQASENSNLHISENNKRIAQVVQSEPIPFIYERIGEQYDHYFIDEFQDTSVLQWQNLLPLIDNSLSKAQFSMVVGDGKQAIYRFRQGEVEQFVQLPNVYQKQDNRFLRERERTLQRNYELDVLQYNYRSCEVIVNFNNEFFEFVAKSAFLAEKHKSIYLGNENEPNSSLKQIPIKDGGYIQIEFLTPPPRGKFQEEEEEEEVNENCLKTFEAIQSALEGGFSYADIAILTRDNKDLQTIAAFLNTQTIAGQSIPLVSSDSFQLYSSAEIRFLYALLQFIENPDLEVAQADILQYLVQKKGLPQAVPEKYFIEMEPGEETFLNLLSENGYVVRLETLLSQSLYDTVESLIRIFGLHLHGDIYLSAFLNYTETFLRKPHQDISSFVGELQKQLKKLSAKMPKGLNAIQLMSIHKSKGLEFEVVIYPFADAKKNNNNSLLWVDCENELGLPTTLVKQKKDLAESSFSEEYENENEKIVLDKINLFYVALTRAAKQLYLIMEKPSKTGETLTYQLLMSRFLQEKGLWEENKTTYVFGEKILLQDTENKNNNNSKNELTTFTSTDWSKKLLIENSQNSLPVTDKSIMLGLLVHDALSRIETEADIPAAAAFLRTEGRLADDEAEAFTTYLLQLIALPNVKPFFEEGLSVRAEAEIILENGRTLRPDRLIFKESETILVDFKTGKPHPSHFAQLNDYRAVLQRMQYPNIKAFLLYLDQEKLGAELVEVDVDGGY